jgi:hypothetical protein
MEKLCYSVKSLSEAIDLGRSKLYEDMASGKLKFFKYGKRRLIRAGDAQKYVDALANDTQWSGK